MSALILFRSLTYAQRASRILERAGTTAAITKAPQGTSRQGCTYCRRLPAARLPRVLQILETNGIQHGRVLMAEMDGSWREVQP